jgi:hypothetical protein
MAEAAQAKTNALFSAKRRMVEWFINNSGF